MARTPMPTHIVEMFEYYWSLGKDRTKSQVAKHYGLSAKTISRYTDRYDWDGLLIERESEVSSAMQQAATEGAIISGVKAAEMVSQMWVEVHRLFVEGKIKPRNIADAERIHKMLMESLKTAGLSEENDNMVDNVASLAAAIAGMGAIKDPNDDREDE